MFEDLRKLEGLTRQELADQTKRSVGYILKAEQATFPSVPIALLDYYVKLGHDAEVLRDAYRSYQRRKREAWLLEYYPDSYTAGVPFRRKWLKRGDGWDPYLANSLGSGLSGSHYQHGERMFLKGFPTQYALSAGMCLPAAVLYRNELSLTHSSSIVTAMEDLVEYVQSGRAAADNLGQPLAYLEEESILRIAKEEGVNLERAGFTSAA